MRDDELSAAEEEVPGDCDRLPTPRLYPYDGFGTLCLPT